MAKEKVKKGLPVEGADAILKAYSEANEAIIKQKKDDKNLNEELRDYINSNK